eukprot:TRINITY_DN12546_c0_g1_i2.p1 TRINITY_DN12546_c0_g1~~TRINITY_DN12546_c0_g1_i2.p1  ORF type:complete len:400 (-),score=43.34 TRINITY_DN12546_c0_g1_i2:190-1389(-)
MYVVSLRALPVSAPSLAWGPAWTIPAGHIICRTSKAYAAQVNPLLKPLHRNSLAETRFMRVYRISEYSFDVDFLSNHDAASVEAMPLYLMTCDPSGSCAPFDAKVQSPRWDACHAAMMQWCPGSRGAAFNCLKCAETNREVLLAACGNWTDQDTLEGEGSFAIHWWCGVGWPESAPQQGPITEYCVEYQPLPETHVEDGFSNYLSCNSDEVDGTLGNDPRDPSCICQVWDDRLLAHQTNKTMKADCYVGGMAWLSETRCNCTGQTPKTVIPQPGNPSLRHVGRMPVWLPYVGVKMNPWIEGNVQVQSGYNYHFPVGGACQEGEEIGAGACTWRRLPLARMLYGADLLDHGWDLQFVPDTPTNMSHTIQNINAFKKALKSLDALVKPSPCGDDNELSFLI